MEKTFTLLTVAADDSAKTRQKLFSQIFYEVCQEVTPFLSRIYLKNNGNVFLHIAIKWKFNSINTFMLPSVFAMWRKWIQSKTCLNSLQLKSAFRQRKYICYLHESLGIKKYEEKPNLWKDSKWVTKRILHLIEIMLHTWRIDYYKTLITVWTNLTYFKVIPYNFPKGQKKKQLGVTKCVLSVKK